jgi:hypothetical protein
MVTFLSVTTPLVAFKYLLVRQSATMFVGVPYMKEKVKRASVVTFCTVESVYILFSYLFAGF